MDTRQSEYRIRVGVNYGTHRIVAKRDGWVDAICNECGERFIAYAPDALENMKVPEAHQCEKTSW